MQSAAKISLLPPGAKLSASHGVVQRRVAEPTSDFLVCVAAEHRADPRHIRNRKAQKEGKEQRYLLERSETVKYFA